MATRAGKPAGHVEPGEAVLWLRMGDADRERYGGPEWVAFDVGRLFHTASSQLEQFEADTGMRMWWLLLELPGRGAKVTRAVLFIARRLAGVQETWDGFDPAPLQVRWREQPPPEEDAAEAGQGKPARPKAAASRRGSAGARSAKSSTTSAPS